MAARTECAENHGDQTRHQNKTREKRTVEKFKRIWKRVSMYVCQLVLYEPQMTISNRSFAPLETISVGFSHFSTTIQLLLAVIPCVFKLNTGTAIYCILFLVIRDFPLSNSSIYFGTSCIHMVFKFGSRVQRRFNEYIDRKPIIFLLRTAIKIIV